VRIYEVRTLCEKGSCDGLFCLCVHLLCSDIINE
jgi:hypothetical protein